MLDKKDVKILSQFILDSRISSTSLGKKVGVSREVASYRIKRLMEQGHIEKCYAVINFKALGFKRYACFLQLKEINAVQEESLFSYLKGHDNITYVGVTIGKWNCVFDILAQDEDELSGVIMQIRQRAAKFIEQMVINNASYSNEIFPLKVIGVNRPPTQKKTSTPMIELDSTDLKILEMLSHDSRMEYAELSSKLGMSANGIKIRIRKLLESGVINGFTTSLNLDKMGLHLYNLQFKSTNPALIGYLKQDKKILYYYNYLGHENWDYDIGILAKDQTELRKSIIDIKDKFGETIRMHDFYFVSEIIKDNIAPKRVFRNK